MGFEAKIVLDSVGRTSGKRLTTMAITYPRFIHSEILTHRDRARNSASSRAIPWPTMMARIENEPVIPIRWGSEQKGMQAGDEIEDPAEATRIWLEARDNAVASARKLAALGVHKSLVNRLTEPWMWITVIMTATQWENLWRLRVHHDAEVHFQKIAGMMQQALRDSRPQVVNTGDWHLPYIQADEQDLDLDLKQKFSVARCARVSYLTHEGKRSHKADLLLYERLVTGSGFGHWSPHEHVAQCVMSHQFRSGPFYGWHQFRKTFTQEVAEGDKIK